MRCLALVAISFGACMSQSDPGPYPGPGGGPYPGPQGAYCDAQTPCTGSDVCARDHECLAPDQARSVMVRWTIAGQPASSLTCGQFTSTQLSIQYTSSSTGEQTGFSPLMCSEGQFFVDVWPVRFDQVTVGAANYAGADMLPPTGDVDVTVDLQSSLQ
jgi:hypothetical protein